ncbi:hypothetical protein GCM10027280_18770 [Micromonospora polyrhachis]
MPGHIDHHAPRDLTAERDLDRIDADAYVDMLVATLIGAAHPLPTEGKVYVPASWLSSTML